MSTTSSALRRLAGSVTVLLVGAVAGLGLLGPAPAYAAACSGTSGVTVVVDFAELGGGVTAGCDSDVDGQRARAILADAGYSLTMASKSPGFMCRINGLPADDPCVDAAPADRYWSVWWADGKGGSWSYSSRGVDSLRVPDGGYLGMAWHEGTDKAGPPATVPAARTAPVSQAPAPTAKPRPGKGSSGSGGGPSTAPQPGGGSTAPGAPATATGGPDSSSGPVPSEDTSPTPTAGDTLEPGETVEVAPGVPSARDLTLGPEDVEATAAESPDGLPGWVVPVVLIALVTAGAVVVLRRRQV